MTPHRLRWLFVGLTLFAFALRLWRLDAVPPGWRDDELINSLVISQKVIDGDWAVYYPDASGHEALYHVLNAFMLWAFGPNIIGIRLLSVFLGTLAVPATYVLGRRLFGWRVGLIAAAALSVSFWALMYSRFGLRHVLMPLLTLLAFAAFWQGFRKLEIGGWRLVRVLDLQSPIANLYLAALFVGLGFYTYFASRGVPLILAVFLVGVALVDRERLRRQWRGWLLMFGLLLLLALPLVGALANQPESEARVAELAVPIIAAREGDLRPLWEYTTITLGMFHATGDNEWLYNIPNRPVFGPVGAVFFWLGVALSLWRTLLVAGTVIGNQLSINGKRQTQNKTDYQPSITDYSYAFLLLWWLAGIAPGFISVPPASLGHTILAQPATFILAALPMGISDWRLTRISNRQSLISWVLALVLLVSIAARDWPAYFEEWPQRGMARFLYRAEVHALAEFVNDDRLTDFGVTGLLAGPWDRVALEIDLNDPTAVSPRWYNPTRAVVLRPSLAFTGYPDVEDAYAAIHEPTGTRVGGYTLAQTTAALPAGERVCFENGLCWATAVYDTDTGLLELGWEVGSALQLPPMPLISNPPPPGVYSGPRLAVFAQLLDAGGDFVTGDDGLWVDPLTLRSGDQFLQQHWLAGEGETVVFGLYDPMTGERILTTDGQDYLELTIND